MSSQSMSRHKINDLIKTIKRANARSSELAAASRALSRPMHKARRHAEDLNLSVSIGAASRLDQKFISTIPLPLLDLAPSRETAPEIIAPVPRYPSQLEVVTDNSGRDVTRPPRPTLRCVVPSQVVISIPEAILSPVHDQPEHIFASKWSASTDGSGKTEGTDDEDVAEVPQPAQVGVRFPGTNDDDNLDILVSPDDDSSSGPQTNQNYFSRPPLLTRLVLQQQEQDPLAHSEEVPELAHFSSGSDAPELITPLVSGELPVSMTGIKRKPLLDDIDMDEDYHMVAEKRPKYERKRFIISARGHQRTASSSRRNG